MKYFGILILVFISNISLYSQEARKEYFINKADSIVTSQCSKEFFELLNSKKKYYYKKQLDLTDSNIDMDRMKDSIYAMKFEKDFHMISYGDLSIYNKIISISDSANNFWCGNINLIFITNSISGNYGVIPNFNLIEKAYNRIRMAKMLSEDQARKILEPKLTLEPHIETDYSLSYNPAKDQIVWKASRTKEAENGRNKNGGRAYLTKEGHVIVESISIDAEKNEILEHEIKDYGINVR